MRVLCRLLRIEEDTRRAATKEQLISASQRLLQPGQAGDFNQGMMELGARVCTPQKPGCQTCPVGGLCRAKAELDNPDFAAFESAEKTEAALSVAAGLIWKRDQVLIAQRPRDGMLGGLWEFPGGKLEERESLQECLRREIREELDFEIEVGEVLCSVDHAHTRTSA